MNMHVRRATPADAEVIASNNRAMALETEERDLDEATLREGVRRCLENPAATAADYFVVEVQARVIGQTVIGQTVIGQTVIGQTMVTREWSDWRNGWFWWIQSVYVAPDHRGRGVFRALWDHVAQQARERGDVIGVRLYVERDNATARATYERLGMTLTDYAMYEIDWSRGA